MVRGWLRGHKIEYSNNEWVYSDNKVNVDKEIRKCTKCNCYPTVEDYDACLGHIPKATHACCGHGITDGYIIYEDGTTKVLKLNK